ncbi:MAG: sodium:proton antiporter, partial [Lachnospiraceae bacterium]|nr:sodium:proton antiporter [Lachnospiraceae bacterium]
AVHYFAWVNLKGSVISIAIGALLYLTVVRRWMMADGIYVNRWPQWLDLEEKLYRPLLLKILPKVGAGIAGVLDILTDGVVVLLRKTLYRDARYHGELEEGNAMTHVIGVTLNVMEELLNKTIWRHHEHRKDLEHWLVLKYASFKETATVIGRSLSFGLVLFCLGLCATLVYLLIFALL